MKRGIKGILNKNFLIGFIVGIILILVLFFLVKGLLSSTVIMEKLGIKEPLLSPPIPVYDNSACMLAKENQIKQLQLTMAEPMAKMQSIQDAIAKVMAKPCPMPTPNPSPNPSPSPSSSPTPTPTPLPTPK
jgi:hypothetical protein